MHEFTKKLAQVLEVPEDMVTLSDDVSQVDDSIEVVLDEIEVSIQVHPLGHYIVVNVWEDETCWHIAEFGQPPYATTAMAQNFARDIEDRVIAWSANR